MGIAIKKFKLVLAVMISTLLLSAFADAAALCDSDEHARCADVADEHIHEDAPVSPCLSCVSDSIAIDLSGPSAVSGGSDVEPLALVFSLMSTLVTVEPSPVLKPCFLQGFATAKAIAIRKTLVILV